MADTIVNTPSSGAPASYDNGAAGWVVAIIVILAVLFAGFFILRRTPAAAPATPGANINVTLPSSGGTGSGTTGGTTGGGATQ